MKRILTQTTALLVVVLLFTACAGADLGLDLGLDAPGEASSAAQEAGGAPEAEPPEDGADAGTPTDLPMLAEFSRGAEAAGEDGTGPAGGAEAGNEDVEAGYRFVVADGAATVVGFENEDGLFAPPAQLGGAPVAALGGGETPIDGVERITGVDAGALAAGYTVARLAFAGAPLENRVDLRGAGAIGDSAFAGAALVPQLKADAALAVGENAFSGAPFAEVEAGEELAAFIADADGLRPGLAGLRLLVGTALPGGVETDNLWILGTEGTGAYTLQVAEAGAEAQSGYDPVAGAAWQVAVAEYAGGDAVPAAFASTGYPVTLELPIPSYSGDSAYLLAVDGVLGSEGVAVRDGKAQVSLQSLPAGGSRIALYTETDLKPVESVDITAQPGNNKMTYGDSFQLAAEAKPADAANKTLEWSSSNASVLAVDENGKLAAKGVGKATVTAAAQDGSGKSASVEIEVGKRGVKVKGITAKSRQYDGTKAAELNVSKASFEGAVSGDALSISAKGAFADEKPGTGKNVKLSDLKLGGAAAGNYTLDAGGSQSTATADITKRQITVADPQVTTQKPYDGTVTAAVSPGTASGILSQDVSGVKLTTSAAYNSPDVGTGKTITVTYALEGGKAGLYQAPAKVTISNAQITSRQAPGAPTNLTAASVKSHVGDSITLATVAGQQYALGVDGAYGYYENGSFRQGWLAPQQPGADLTFGGLTPGRTYTFYTRVAPATGQAQGAVSAPLEVVLYSLAQQQVLDDLAPLEPGVSSAQQVEALLAVTKEYEALGSAERQMLDENFGTGATLEKLQQQAAQVNHESGNVAAEGAQLPWYVRLDAENQPEGSEAWNRMVRAIGGGELVLVEDISLSDLETGEAYRPKAGEIVYLSVAPPAAPEDGQLTVAYLEADGTARTHTPEAGGDGAYRFESRGDGLYGLVVEGAALPGASSEAEEPESGVRPWVIVLIVVLVLAAAATVTVLILRRRNRMNGEQ